MTATYDRNGNLSTLGTASYGYDPENRMIAGSMSGGTVLTYDPLGRLWRIASPVHGKTDFVYDGAHVAVEYDGDTGGIRRRFFWGPGADEPILQDEGGAMNCSGTRVLHGDERGSVVAAADCFGVRQHVNAYDEYGNPAPGNWGRYGYTGQAWLQELDLWFYKNRMYSPSLGRFMQTDPIGYGDGPNLYGYVKGDPVNRVDPSGLDDVEGPEVVVQAKSLNVAIPSTSLPTASFFSAPYIRFVPVVNYGTGGGGGGDEQPQKVTVDKSCPAGGPAYNPGVQAKALNAANLASTEQQRNPDGPPFREYGFTGRSNFFPSIFGKGYVTGDIQRGYQGGVSLDIGWFDTFSVHTHSGPTGPSPRDIRNTPSGFTNIVIGRDRALRCYTGR